MRINLADIWRARQCADVSCAEDCDNAIYLMPKTTRVLSDANRRGITPQTLVSRGMVPTTAQQQYDLKKIQGFLDKYHIENTIIPGVYCLDTTPAQLDFGRVAVSMSEFFKLSDAQQRFITMVGGRRFRRDMWDSAVQTIASNAITINTLGGNLYPDNDARIRAEQWRTYYTRNDHKLLIAAQQLQKTRL